jgi:curli production assembly/transport component CsgF
LASFVALSCSSIVAANAGQLIYQPVNPAFGGNPLNGSFILGEASANNYRYLQAPSTNTTNSGPSTAQQFSSQITSALLSQVAAQIGNEIIGPNAKDSGTFNVGGQIITFNRSGGQININLTDSGTGGTTNIQIPVPNY